MDQVILTPEELHLIEKHILDEIMHESVESEKVYRHLVNHRGKEACMVISDWIAKLARLHTLIKEQDAAYQEAMRG